MRAEAAAAIARAAAALDVRDEDAFAFQKLA
jgi:hypothetical protein